MVGGNEGRVSDIPLLAVGPGDRISPSRLARHRLDVPALNHNIAPRSASSSIAGESAFV
jgi:hypothetical protein